MKKLLLLFTFLLLLIHNSVFYGQTILYDGETAIPDFWDIGGGFVSGVYSEGPNGADCHQGEGWKLYVSGKMDLLSANIQNPDQTGENTTNEVMRLVRNPNGEGWAGSYWDISSHNIDINTTNHFSVLIKKPLAGNVTLKLEGTGSEEATSYYSTPDEWQKLDFYFNPTNFSGNPSTLLIFPHNSNNLTENTIVYFDEITIYDELTPIVLFDGSDQNSLHILDGYWSPNGELNNLETDLFPNLFKDKVNGSNHVIRFIRAKDGYNWCGFGLGGLNLDITSTPIISLLVNKPMTGKVGVKLEGAGSKELYADYTTPNQWQRLTFKFDSSDFSGNPTTIIIFPHFESTDINNLSDHTPIYIDNVIIRNSDALPTDYFRTNSSGSWSNSSTWESSYDNQNWISSNIAPDIEATNIHIRENNLITISSNATASKLFIDAGGQLTIDNSVSLNCDSLHILSNETNGTGTFIDNGTFTSNDNTIEQYLSAGRNWYISSPIVETRASDITLASQIVSYNESSATWPVTAPEDLLQVGKGYISVTNTTGKINLHGSFNSGTISTGTLSRTSGISKEGFNLVGNPYPSYVDFNSASRTNLSSTIWYRTKNSSSNYVFDTYNALTEIGTSNNNDDNIAVNGYIPPFQAFWIRTLEGGGSLTFNNSNRLHQDQSIVPNRLKIKSSSDKSYLRLGLLSGINSDETLLVFHPLASDTIDDYDSPKMSNNNLSVAEIYSIVNNEKLVINSMQNIPFDKEINIGYTSETNNIYTFKIKEFAGFNSDTQLFLIDHKTEETINLTDLYEYTFQEDSNLNPGRFSLLFKNRNDITNTANTNAIFHLNIWNKGNSMTLLSFDTIIEEYFNIYIYDITGHAITNKNHLANMSKLYLNLNTGIYYVRIESTNDKSSYTKKLIIH